MSAMFVGRVGGLAVALGVGAAALQAAGAAWADDAASPDHSGSSASASVNRGSVNAGPAARASHVAAGRAARNASPTAARPANPAAVKVAPAARTSVDLAPAAAAASAAAVSSPAPAESRAGVVARRSAAASTTSITPTAAAAVAPTYQQGNCISTTTACTFVLSPSGVPIPSRSYIDTVMDFYVMPNTQTNQTAQGVSTPEGAYPVTGIKSLPIAISVPLGQTILENTISAFTPGPQPGTIPVTLFGYSQSAIISSLMQRSMGSQVGYLPGLNRSTTSMVTVGQEMSPNGGWYARFPGLNAPSLGWTLYGSTPENQVATTNYTLEYDGFADYPRYPMNIISDLNAALGILTVHLSYANRNYFAKNYGTVLGSYDFLMGTQGPGVACNAGSPSCTALPTTSATQKYYFINTPDLPLLAPVRAIPFIGKPLAALVQPFLKVIVDLGYADPAHGFASATQPMANVPVPFGVFPRVSPAEVIKKLIASIPEGIKDFMACVGGGCKTQSSGGGLNINVTPKELIATLPLRLSAAVSAMVAPLLSATDFLNATLIALPNYNLSLMAEALKQAVSGEFIQGVTNFLLRPIAADVGMVTTFVMAQLTVSLLGVVGAITGCGPGAPTTGLCIIG